MPGNLHGFAPQSWQSTSWETSGLTRMFTPSLLQAWAVTDMIFPLSVPTGFSALLFCSTSSDDDPGRFSSERRHHSRLQGSRSALELITSKFYSHAGHWSITYNKSLVDSALRVVHDILKPRFVYLLISFGYLHIIPAQYMYPWRSCNGWIISRYSHVQQDNSVDSRPSSTELCFS